MKADAPTEKAVIKILQDLSDGCASKQVQQVLGLFAADANVVLLGSEEGEKAIGPTELERFLKRLFSRHMAYSFEWRWHLVSIEGPVAWVVAEGLIHAKSADEHVSSPYRVTVVLKKKAGKWLITHYHGSEPAIAHKRAKLRFPLINRYLSAGMRF